MLSRTPWTLPGDPTLPLHSATKQYVDNTRSAPGATAMSVASGTATPQAANGASHHRVTTSATITIAPAAGSVDTQRMTYEIITTAAVTINLDATYEVGGNARVRSFSVRSGATAYVYVINRQGTLRLTGIDDGG